MDLLSCTERLKIINNGTLYNKEPLSEPLNLKVPLKTHQLVMINAMNELESSVIQIDEQRELNTKIGICADCTGAGKSYDVIGLIQYKPILNSKEKVHVQFGNLVHFNVKPQETEPINIIITPHQCMNQWIEYIENVSNLNFYVIIIPKWTSY